jgi:hypothetical protein
MVVDDMRFHYSEEDGGYVPHGPNARDTVIIAQSPTTSTHRKDSSFKNSPWSGSETPSSGLSVEVERGSQDEPSPENPPWEDRAEWCRAVYDFVAGNEDELDLKEGDYVFRYREFR